MPPKKEKEDEEMSKSRPKISFSDLEKSMIIFTGDDTFPISTWIQEFEDAACIMEWSKIEKLVYAKRLLDGTARLFLRSFGSVTDWETLKASLKEEFCPKLNSAIVHKKLASRKMKNDETFQQYFLHMRELALHASVEDEALMEYVIDGIRDSETNKAILYGAKDIKEFRAKLESYSNLRKRIEKNDNIRNNNPTTSVSFSSAGHTGRKSTIKRCYNCGDTDHLAPACTKGIKCFRCNEFGHKGNECPTLPKKSLNVQAQKEENKAPFKNIKINGVEMIALLDTGSDVNLIKISKLQDFKQDKPKYENNTKIGLTGIGKREIDTEGYFTAKLHIDDCYTDAVFHVVNDEAIPVDLILGNPILHDFSIKFTSDGITVGKHNKKDVDKHDGGDDDECDVGSYDGNEDEEEYDAEEDKEDGSEEENDNDENGHENNDDVEDNDDEDVEDKAEEEVEFVEEDSDEVYEKVDEELKEEKREKVLSKLSIEDPTKWYRYVAAVQRALNGTFQRSVGMTPFELLIGIEMRDKNNEILKLIEEENIADYNEKRFDLRRKAKESIQKIQDENRRNYNKNRKEANQYNVGDLVAMKRTQFTQGSKLYSKFLWPYEIVKKKRNNRYAVKKVGHSEGPIITTSSADLMKPWLGYDLESSESDD